MSHQPCIVLRSPFEQRIFEAVKARGGIARLPISGDMTHPLQGMIHNGILHRMERILVM
jgi:hypothetical protein